MKILVTVGSSSFDKLIKHIDQNQFFNNYDITFQIGDGKYEPKNHNFKRFYTNFESQLLKADLIISHGGAGTIFTLLEMNKKFIVVPNLERVDKHQLDLSNFINKNQYGSVCLNLEELMEVFKDSLSFSHKKYKKEMFFMTQSIINYFTQ